MTRSPLLSRIPQHIIAAAPRDPWPRQRRRERMALVAAVLAFVLLVVGVWIF